MSDSKTYKELLEEQFPGSILCEHHEASQFNPGIWWPRFVRFGRDRFLLLCPLCSGKMVEEIFKDVFKDASMTITQNADDKPEHPIYAGVGKQGIHIEPVGSHDTDPFEGQP